jgi:hypothetical protein
MGCVVLQAALPQHFLNFFLSRSNKIREVAFEGKKFHIILKR